MLANRQMQSMRPWLQPRRVTQVPATGMPESGDPYASASVAEHMKCWRMIHDRQGRPRTAWRWRADRGVGLHHAVSGRSTFTNSSEDTEPCPITALRD